MCFMKLLKVSGKLKRKCSHREHMTVGIVSSFVGNTRYSRQPAAAATEAAVKQQSKAAAASGKQNLARAAAAAV